MHLLLKSTKYLASDCKSTYIFKKHLKNVFVDMPEVRQSTLTVFSLVVYYAQILFGWHLHPLLLIFCFSNSQCPKNTKKYCAI